MRHSSTMLAALALAATAPAAAQVTQDDAVAETAAETIAEGRAAYDPVLPESECGQIVGDAIVICAPTPEDPDRYRIRSAEEVEDDYARRTMNKDNPQGPDLFGIPNHGNPIGFGRVPPPAIFIDVTALPQAPPGSDADRIARGLPPLGRDAPRREDPALIPDE